MSENNLPELKPEVLKVVPLTIVGHRDYRKTGHNPEKFLEKFSVVHLAEYPEIQLCIPKEELVEFIDELTAQKVKEGGW